MSLSEERLDRYHQDGYLIIPQLISPAECDDMNAEIDRLITEDARAAGVEPHPKMWLMQLGLRSEITRRLACDERLLAAIEDIVKPGIAIYSAKLVPKAPHSNEICHWHQDDSFYQDNSLSPVRMSTWLALQDSHPDNGAVHFIPGSHRWGQQPWHAVDDQHCRRTISKIDPDIIKQSVCPVISKGSVVLFSSFTWHYSGPNHSDELRRSFIVSYQDVLTPKGNGQQWKILRPAPTTEAAAF